MRTTGPRSFTLAVLLLSGMPLWACDKNGTGAPRTGQITVRDKIVVVTQAGT